ncbi:unnamed protein product [Cylicocyclus nassatus]|uniref:Uncharacterized protein n=1 Tax=Cylicocyclus nassatus TaxID=53992 RepID=A0AA36DMJ2_CYLNA|nr:unnamed protein product [Cylicocyclus nassatus]
MLAETIHSHLLFILATTYFHLLVFTFVGGLNAFSMIANTTAKTAEEVGEQMQSILVVGSFALHCAALVCAIVCILFNDVEKIRVKMPTIVVVVILTFTTSFNAVAALLLFLYRPKDQKEPIMLAAAVVSLLATLFAIGVLIYFYKRPPKGPQFRIEQRLDIPPPPPPQFIPPPAPPGGPPYMQEGGNFNA